MKQFDPSKPYRLRDGRPAKIVHTFRKGHHFVVLDDTDGWVIVFADGRYGRGEGKDSEYDLINIPETLDRTRPVQTRDGREVRNICWDYLLTRGQVGIAGVIRSMDGSRDYWQEWLADGQVYLSTGPNTKAFDNLINVPVNIPEKIEGWQNVYKGRDGGGVYYSLGKLFSTREEALVAAYGIAHVACIKVSFTEGEGLL